MVHGAELPPPIWWRHWRTVQRWMRRQYMSMLDAVRERSLYGEQPHAGGSQTLLSRLNSSISSDISPQQLLLPRHPSWHSTADVMGSGTSSGPPSNSSFCRNILPKQWHLPRHVLWHPCWRSWMPRQMSPVAAQAVAPPGMQWHLPACSGTSTGTF